MRETLRIYVLVGLVAMLGSNGMGRGVWAQQTQGPTAGMGEQNPVPTTAPPFGATPPAENEPAKERLHQQMQQRQNDERHKRLAADVDRLLTLTTELKAAVDKATKDELSVEVVRKAAEIEKLAHEVKEREKN